MIVCRALRTFFPVCSWFEIWFSNFLDQMTFRPFNLGIRLLSVFSCQGPMLSMSCPMKKTPVVGFIHLCC